MKSLLYMKPLGLRVGRCFSICYENIHTHTLNTRKVLNTHLYSQVKVTENKI